MLNMKREYVCKFCGRVIVTDYGVKSINFLPTLIDHLMIRHRDKLDEIGGVYLSDIPKVCYTMKTEDISNGVVRSKNKPEDSFLYTDFA